MEDVQHGEPRVRDAPRRTLQRPRHRMGGGHRVANGPGVCGRAMPLCQHGVRLQHTLSIFGHFPDAPRKKRDPLFSPQRRYDHVPLFLILAPLPHLLLAPAGAGVPLDARRARPAQLSRTSRPHSLQPRRDGRIHVSGEAFAGPGFRGAAPPLANPPGRPQGGVGVRLARGNVRHPPPPPGVRVYGAPLPINRLERGVGASGHPAGR
mmetsp:Transcript_55544/g.131874  ORF Transcript_55544/g.131874 Transcript_55544/m.131874 type:complete len:207 (+) Transcript_55544:1339-1959(+)